MLIASAVQVNIWCTFLANSLTVFPLQSSTYRAWSFISDEMYASADAHRYDTTLDEALFIIHVGWCYVFILGLFFQHTGKCSQPRCYSGNPSNPRWTRQKKKTGISLNVYATYACNILGFTAACLHYVFFVHSSTMLLKSLESLFLQTGVSKLR